MKFPLILKWSITDKCNLRCKHCYKSNFERETTKDDIDLIIKELTRNKIACVALTGGEPTLSNHFPYILKKLKKSKIKTEIASNGFFLSDNIIGHLKKYNVKRIQISLEGPNAKINDSIRGADTFNVVLNNIKKLISENIEVVIANTLNHYNCFFIDEMVELFMDLKAIALRFESYIPIRKDCSTLSLTKNDLMIIRKKIYKYNNQSNIIFPVFHDNRNCGAGIYMAMLNSDNTLSPCDLLSDIIRSSNKINKFNTIKEIWTNDKIFKEWRKKNYKGCLLSDDY